MSEGLLGNEGMEFFSKDSNLAVMEALEHLFISRKYKEFFANSRSISTENSNINNPILNNDKKSPFSSFLQQINKNSENYNEKKIENSCSHKEKENLCNTNCNNNKNNHVSISNAKKKNQYKSNKNFRQMKNDKKNNVEQNDSASAESASLREAKATLNSEQQDEGTNANDHSVASIKQNENNSNYFTQNNEENEVIRRANIQERYVVDNIAENSEGIILLTPGRGKIRFGSIIPDDDVEAKSFSEQIINLSSSNLTPIEANEGDYVTIPDSEGDNQRGKVLCKLGSTYYILLIDSGIIATADKVYSLEEKMKRFHGLGVVITIQEIFSEESVIEMDVCCYSVTKKKEEGKWICRLKSTDKVNVLANIIIERPSEKGSTRFLKSGCSVELLSVASNTFYVREKDESSGLKLVQLNKKINEFCKIVPSLPSLPKVGDLCSAKFEDDQLFYRGLVKSFKSEKLEILFVDLGKLQFFEVCFNSSTNVKMQNLKPLPLGFQAIPFFAIPVSLVDVLPGTYSNEAKNYLQNLILESSELILSYQKLNEGVFLKEKITGKIVNDILKNKNSETLNISVLGENDKFLGHNLEYTLFSLGTKCNLALLYVSEKEFQESFTFWCSDVSSRNFSYVHSELSSKILDYCKTCVDPYRPVEQELCLAKYEGVWYRALTLDADNDNFIVFFPDFGNMCELTSECIRKIKKEFIAPPALAVNCTIIDPERLKGKPEITKRVFEVLENWMNNCALSVEICKYENETFYLRVPEIEAVILVQ